MPGEEWMLNLAVVHPLLFSQEYGAGCTGRQVGNSTNSEESNSLSNFEQSMDLPEVSIPSLDNKNTFTSTPQNQT